MSHHPRKNLEVFVGRRIGCNPKKIDHNPVVVAVVDHMKLVAVVVVDHHMTLVVVVVVVRRAAVGRSEEHSR